MLDKANCNKLSGISFPLVHEGPKFRCGVRQGDNDQSPTRRKPFLDLTLGKSS